MKVNENKKHYLLLLISLFFVIGIIGGITYSFFNYTKTGNANTFKVGRISFISRQTDTINLTNLFPIASSSVDNDTDNVGIFELEIEGDTDNSEGLEYLISIDNAHITTSTGQIIPISIDVNVSNLGNNNSNYFVERNSKDNNMYKQLANGIIQDEMLFVGYIKPNTSFGTKEGINGKITIKAYLDKDKVAISDTYDGNQTDLNGTSSDWVDKRVVLTTNEWNSLQTSGITFQVKVEANEGIWVEETLYDILDRNAVMDNINSEFVNNTTPGIDFSQISSDTNGKGVYIFSETETDAYPVKYYRGDINNNNVLFANKCWKMVRTTDTGGTKLIYNGENKGTSEAPNCDNTGADSQITLNIDNEDINTFAFNDNSDSPAYSGYMYGDIYSYNYDFSESDIYYGSDFTWDGTNYQLVDAVTEKNNEHHYSCFLEDPNGTCAILRYYYAGKLYVELTDGDSIEDAMRKMKTNTNNSNAKEMLDIWYETYISNTNYDNELEDTIWCNDRSMGNNNGWIANGGNIQAYLNYGALERSNNASDTSILKNHPSLACKNKNDRFTVSNAIGNQALDYPMAMLTTDEVTLAGGLAGVQNVFYLNNGMTAYWLMSPHSFFGLYAREFALAYGTIDNGNVKNKAAGLRPSLSLKNDTIIVDNEADGSVSKPYVIK